MNDFNFKPNSALSKEKSTSEVPAKKSKQVATAVKISKKGKISTAFSANLRNIAEYVVGDVIIPAAKKAVSDIVVNGIDMVLYPNGGGRNKTGGRSSTVSYRSYYDDRNRYEPRAAMSSNTRYSYDDVIVSTRDEGQNALRCLDEMLEQYGRVSVADLYDLVGITGDYTDNRYGWTSLVSASLVPCKDGYLLKLPRAKALS